MVVPRKIVVKRIDACDVREDVMFSTMPFMDVIIRKDLTRIIVR
jgi:hypothetical protein